MEKKSKKPMATDMKIFMIVCAVIAVILITAVVYLIKPKDVAVVGNSRVTADEFKYYFSQNLQMMLNYSSMVDDQQMLIDYSKQMALSQAIEVEYLLQEAQKDGFKADQKEIDDALASFEKSITDAAAKYQLKVEDFCEQSFGVGLNKVKTIYKDALRAQKYMETKIAEVPADEATIAAYYEENKDTFDYNTVRHILVTCAEDAEESLVQEKNKAAEDILTRVNNGEDFAALAKEFSEDDGSKDTGGVYDVYKNGGFVPSFEEWAFTHKPGDTGIVRSEHGFHIMKHDAANDTLDASREAVTKAYQSNEYQKKMDDALNNGSIKVEILEGYSDI